MSYLIELLIVVFVSRHTCIQYELQIICLVLGAPESLTDPLRDYTKINNDKRKQVTFTHLTDKRMPKLAASESNA